MGLGSDGTVGANKNSVKIIGENTPLFAQGYFVYDSKKSGAITVSHLRFSPRPIRSTYLIEQADFVACHQFNLLEKIDVLKIAADGATFLLNSPYRGRPSVGPTCHAKCNSRSSTKQLRFFVVDGYDVARRNRHGRTDQHADAEPASSHLPGCCRGTKRSSTSRRPSARRTASGARRSLSRISPPSIWHLSGCNR